jgi:hypothetical protein
MAVRCASDLRRFETLVSTRGNRRLETTRGAAVMDEHQVRRSTARASGLPNASEREPALWQRASTSSFVVSAFKGRFRSSVRARRGCSRFCGRVGRAR